LAKLNLNGGIVRNYKQPLLTIFVIFAAAYILTILGCSPTSSSNSPAAAVPEAPVLPIPEVQPEEEVALQELDPKDLRECTADEFSVLVDWSLALLKADESLKSMGSKNSWKKNQTVVQQATVAIHKCDQVQFYHSLKPCKRTKTTREITRPDKVITTVNAYDAFRINKRCQNVDTYLTKFNLRPDPKQTEPKIDEPQQPLEPNNPDEQSTDIDNSVDTPTDNLSLRQCSSDEFAKLNLWRASLDLANKNIAKLGSQSDWKYEPKAIDAATTATKNCEAAISYHQSQPCKREKSYTGQSLRDQCSTSRSYYYNFAQRTESLIVPNAKLYLNTSVIANRNFASGPANLSFGQCVLTNLTDSSIQYAGQKTLVKEARVYTDVRYQMFVLVTQEGLKFECYGLDYSSAATSLSEVVRLLSAKESRLPLSYELN
jgi:hypothetical protein